LHSEKGIDEKLKLRKTNNWKPANSAILIPPLGFELKAEVRRTHLKTGYFCAKNLSLPEERGMFERIGNRLRFQSGGEAVQQAAP
jgi:hypothetical protein